MKKKIFSWLAIFALVAVTTAFATSGAQTNGGCTTFTRQVTNNADSAVWGGFWALDDFTQSYEVCPDDGEIPGGTITRTDTGTFLTWAGLSPNNSGNVGAGIQGTLSGTWTFTFVGEIDEAAPTTLPAVDYACDQNGSCTFPPSIFDTILADGSTVSANDDWKWVYTACDGSQWTNQTDALGGNQGDITLAGNCPAKPEKATRSCSWAFNQIWGKTVNKDVALRYMKHHPTCYAWSPGYYWYWRGHPELLNNGGH